MTATVDWSDPCARAAALSEAYFTLVKGGVSMIRVRAAGGEREVRYHKAEMTSLRLEMQRAEDECRAQQGLPPLTRRFAITAGSRRV